MAAKKQAEPSDADTVLRELRRVLERHGWSATATGVDPEGTITISGKVQPQPEPAE